MKLKTNYHTHTPLCRHALGTDASEYALAAYQSGLDILGFSDHAPFKNHDLGYRMLYKELPLYLKQIEALQKEYEGRMQIKKGLEIEYLPYYKGTDYPGEQNYYEYLLNDLKCDYLLLGEHFFGRKDGSFLNVYDIDSSDTFPEYAAACVEAMSTGYFGIIAHPDLFGVRPFAWDKNYDKACDIIIEGAAKYNVILEYNANGHRRGIQEYPDGPRRMYPLEGFWNKVAGSNLPVIIGSDNHEPSQVWDYAMEEACVFLANIGITPIETIQDNRYNKK